MPDTTEILHWLWQTTWQTALLAAVIAIIARIFRAKLSPGAVSLLWMLVFIRMLMPALPGSSLSIFTLFEQPDEPVVLVGWAPPTFDAQSDLRWAMPTLQIAPPTMVEVPSRWKEYTALAIWIGGTALLIAHVFLVTFRFSRKLNRSARPADERTLALVEECSDGRTVRVLVTDSISTPAIFGVLRPRLLLPPVVLAQLGRVDLRSVILHELEHMRRRHLLTDWLFTLIRAVHWFNPAAWWAHRQIRAARELICDQSVLAGLDETNTRSYGLTMLAMAGGLRPGPMGVPVAAFARDYRLLKRRIEAIAGKRRYLAGLGVMLALVLGMCFLTAPRSTAQDAPAPATQPTAASGRALNSPKQATTQDGVATLIAAAQKFIQDSDYPQAITVLKQILEQDPENEFARTALPLVEDRAISTWPRGAPLNNAPPEARLRYVQIDLEYKTKVLERKVAAGTFTQQEILQAQNDVEVARRQVETVKAEMDRAILEWQRESRRRFDAAMAAAPADPNIARLERYVPEMRFDSIPLSDVIEFFRDVSGANLIVNWPALETVGVRRDTPVTARLRDVTFATALKVVLNSAGGPDKLAYRIGDGVIDISTIDDLYRRPNGEAIKGNPMRLFLPPEAYAFPLLDRTLPQVRFDNVGFADVIDFFRDLTGANIVVNWPAVEAAGVGKNTPLSANMWDVKFRKALETVLEDVGGKTVQLGYVVKDGVITISSAADLNPPASQPALQAEPIWFEHPRNPPENAATLAQLDRNLPEVRFDNIGFADAIAFFRDVSGANIFVNWRALEAAGVAKNKPVTARLRDVKFSKAIETILRDAGGGVVRLGYAVDEGVITISTAADLEANVVTTVYDINDLLIVLDRNAPAEAKKQLIDQLLLLITDTVARESWRQNGGNSGSIRELSGQLIVTQTPDNQRNVRRLIQQLRETRAAQISIEARKLVLTREQAAALRGGVAAGSVHFLDDFQMGVLLRVAETSYKLTTVAAPFGRHFNGEVIKLNFNDGAPALDLQSTIGPDWRHITLTLSAPIVPQPATQPAGALNTGISRINISTRKDQPSSAAVPDGANLLVMTQADPDSGREAWLILKPTIVRQREREAFPILNQQPPPP